MQCKASSSPPPSAAPLIAATGVRLIAQLAYGLRERGGRYGLTALCIGMGMGCAILWENVQQ